MKTFSLFVFAILFSGGIAQGSAISELEPNDTFGTAMVLSGGVTRIDAEMISGDLVGGLLVDGDVDYFVFNGLAPGSPFIAQTMSQNPTVDTLLGLFSPTGVLMQLSDDALGGTGLPALSSILHGTVPLSGSLSFAVTGFPDTDFIGGHPEYGLYSFELSIVPEPSGGVMCFALAAFMLRFRVR